MQRSRQQTVPADKATPSAAGQWHVPSTSITRISPWSVDETVARLTAVIDRRGLKLFDAIDQSAEARQVGLALRDTRLLLFGSPKAGTPLMQAAPLSALDLPLRVVVWGDAERTMVSYPDPAELAARYGLAPDLAAPLSAPGAIVDEVISR